MRAGRILSALVTCAGVACLAVAAVKAYESRHGTYGAYMDESGVVTAPGAPDPHPWLQVGLALVVVGIVVAVVLVWRSHRRRGL